MTKATLTAEQVHTNQYRQDYMRVKNVTPSGTVKFFFEALSNGGGDLEKSWGRSVQLVQGLVSTYDENKATFFNTPSGGDQGENSGPRWSYGAFNCCSGNSSPTSESDANPRQ